MKIVHSRFEGTLNKESTELAGQVIHGDGEHVSPMTLRKKQQNRNGEGAEEMQTRRIVSDAMRER